MIRPTNFLSGETNPCADPQEVSIGYLAGPTTFTDIAALERQLGFLSSTVNEYTSEPGVRWSHQWNSSVILEENHNGCGEWCRGDDVASRVESKE